MAQHVLMILPSTEDESPRMVGPFLTEGTANNWADREGIDQVRRIIRPLETPTSLYGYGRHALIPSPTPRAPEGYELVKPTVPLRRDGGPELHARPIRRPKSGEPERERRITITGEAEHGPAGGLTGGIKHWVSGEALKAAPYNVLSAAEAVAIWSGSLARFGVPTKDGRVLELNGLGSGDWLGHFLRIPVGVWVMVPNVGALPIGLCERVRVEDGWLLGEGRISIGHFQKAAPELFAKSFPSWETGVFTADMEETPVPAAIDVTNGVRTPDTIVISGPWELERVVFGSVPAWPGCAVRFDSIEMG
jgi:hypothetical protein